MEIIAATNNENKLRELKAILKGKFEVVSLKEKGIFSDPDETGETFEENSEIKARSAMEKSNLPAIADDSGLYVYSLDGAPGVYSARFAGENATDEENNRLLLEKMKDKTDRKAKFVSVVTLVFPDGKKVSGKGECEGEILFEYRGDGGFGYDPLFYVPEIKKTFAEMTDDEKNKVSHRAKALKDFEERLKEIDND